LAMARTDSARDTAGSGVPANPGELTD
jgi:hypothetical protein